MKHWVLRGLSCSTVDASNRVVVTVNDISLEDWQ